MFGSKLINEFTSEAVKKCKIITCNNNVIYIKEQVDDIRLPKKGEERCISIAKRETKGKEKGAKALKPSTRSLLETIESFL